MQDAIHTFHQQAATYDSPRRRLIPPFDAFYATATDAVGLATDVHRVLDLGAGTGMLAARVQHAHPDAELTLLDGAAGMLERATVGAHHIVADLTDPLPAGPWDAIVSALAIHHLDDAPKQDLYKRINEALRPGGVFVNAEHVAGPTSRFTALYEQWHEREARAAGSDDAEWAGALERMRHDRCASVEDQLAWLRQAGFEDADCLFKHHRFAVLVAIAG